MQKTSGHKQIVKTEQQIKNTFLNWRQKE